MFFFSILICYDSDEEMEGDGISIWAGGKDSK